MHIPMRLLMIITTTSLAGSLVAAEPKKLPIPDPDQQRSVQADVRMLYRVEYAKKTAADIRAFAAKLLQLGAETKGDVTSRFVLISEGRDLAAKAADPALVLKAISQLGSEYQIDEVAMKADALDATGAAAAIPSAHRAVSIAATSATEEAIKLDRYAESVRLAALASRSAAKSKDEALAKKAAAREKETREVAVSFELNKAADMRLKLDPTDEGAARAVGRFRCLMKGDWDVGLPLLGQGAEGKLKDLAKQDLGSPKSAEDRRSLADGYWLAAESEKGMAATQLKRRACHYYRLALPDLTGLALERTKRRLEEFEPPGPWDHLDIGKAEVIEDFLRMPPSMIQTKESFAGPFEMRIVVRLPANDIRLAGPSASAVIFNWGDKPQELRVHRPDGNTEEARLGSVVGVPTQPLKLNAWHTLRWKLTATECSVWANDKLVFSEKGKYDLSSKEPVRFFSIPDGVDVKSFTVRPVR